MFFFEYINALHTAHLRADFRLDSPAKLGRDEANLVHPWYFLNGDVNISFVTLVERVSQENFF
jgi:hypothetical protein